MTISDKILLGFEVSSGDPVYIAPHHLGVFGMTQLSGKTTTLEALISRSNLRALAFITKRGETGFSAFNLIPPFYRERSDWRYVESLVNTALGEKVKYEPGMRNAIMKVSRGTHNLREVKEQAEKKFEQARRQFMKDVYDRLIAYLEIVIPELERWKFSGTLELENGVNVMDISGMRLEVQQLVIGSSIEYVFKNLSNVVVILPEAWEMLPQSRMTPVKWVAEQFIRKGAAIRNYLWIDSQDIGGIDKTPLRQVSTWLMGRMMEAHEVSRILKQLLGLKIKPKEVQTLPLGHFFVTLGDQVKKVYVLPAGVSEEIGRKVALGELNPSLVRDQLKSSQSSEDEKVWKERFEDLKQEEKVWKKNLDDLKREYEALKAKYEAQLQDTIDNFKAEKASMAKELHIAKSLLKEAEKDLQTLESLKKLLASLLPKQPTEAPVTKTAIDLKHAEVVVNVTHQEQEINFSTENQRGQIVFCGVRDLPKEGFTEAELSAALSERGWNIPHNSLAPQLGKLVKEGIFLKLRARPTRYRLPGKLKINAREA